MSGIFGVVRFGASSHAPLDAGRAMAGAMSRWGDSEPTSVEYAGALFGHALRVETPEDVWSAMPVALPERDLLFVSEGRLDNRVDVLLGLGIASAEAAEMADSTLVLRAYLEWGDDCCRRLIGDWSFAAWHPRQQRLAVGRDHHGNTSVFTFHDRSADAVAFASDPRALIAAGAPRRLNELHLAQVLVSWSGAEPLETVDLDIFRVPPAHLASVSPDGMAVRQYWAPPRASDDSRGTAEEYAERLRTALDDATRARCRSARGLATTLSGGLDSGSVTALAARSVLADGGTLTAYTSVPIAEVAGSVGRGRFGDETALSSATARYCGVRSHVLLDSARVTPMQGVRRALDALDRPAHAASNAFWIHDLLESAAEHGHSTLLTGQCGNATISWTGRTQIQQLRRRWHDRGIVGVGGYFAPASFYRHWVARSLQRDDWRHTAIEPRFAARLDLAARQAAARGRDNQPLPRAGAMDVRWAILQPGASRVGDVWSQNTGWSGVDVRDPTADPRVIEASFAIPDELFRGPDGADRWMLRTAMQGLLPDEVRLNADRGQQSSDLVERLRRSAAEVDDAIAEVSGGPAEEYVSLARIRAAWAAARQSSDAATTHRSGSILLRGMMAALWLQRTYG